MGQKVSPVAFRLALKNSWPLVWQPSSSLYAKNLRVNIQILKYFKRLEKELFISHVRVESFAGSYFVTLYTSRPNLVVKKSGSGIEVISADLSKIANAKVSLNVRDVKAPDTNAKIIGVSIATQVEKRVSYVKAIKKAMQLAMKQGVLGIKICCSGRLSGAEIARSETYKEGSVPLHTLKAKIDYALTEAVTTYGVIGIKVWIYRNK